MWTEAPILSVDYSLAPEAPYPRAVEEVLFAYVWSLNNLSALGTNAKKIVFAGLLCDYIHSLVKKMNFSIRTNAFILQETPLELIFV